MGEIARQRHKRWSNHGGAGKEEVGFVRKSRPLPARARPHCALRFLALATLLAASACDNSSEPDLVPAPEFAACVDYGEYLRVVGSLPFDHPPTDMLAAGEILYVALDRSIQIFEVTDQELPQYLATVDVDARHLALVSGNRLCAFRSDRLTIIDVTQPRAPVIQSKERIPVFVQCIATEGDLVCVGTQSHGLWILNMASPPMRRIVGSVSLAGQVTSVAMAGSVACASHVDISFYGITTVDISDPSSPRRLGRLEGLEARKIELNGLLALTAGGGHFSGGVHTFDMSNPAKPSLVAEYDIDASDIAISGDRVFVAGSGLLVLNILNPRSPVVVADLAGTQAAHLELHDERLYLARSESRGSMIDVVDISNVRLPQPLARVNFFARDITVRGTEAYLCTYDNLLAVDVTGIIPTIKRRLNIPRAQEIEFDGTLGYVATPYGLQVVNVGDSAPEVFLGGIDLPNSPSGVAIGDGLAYLSLGQLGLWIVDISDPLHCRIVGSVDTPSEAWDVALQGRSAYVADGGNGLVHIDVSNPSSPYIAGSVPLRDALALTIADGFAYVVGRSGLSIFDISTRKPELIGMAQLAGHFEDVVLYGNIAYIAGEGVHAIDVSSPSAPIIIGSVAGGFASGVGLDPTRIFVAGDGGFTVFPHQCGDATEVTP